MGLHGDVRTPELLFFASSSAKSHNERTSRTLVPLLHFRLTADSVDWFILSRIRDGIVLRIGRSTTNLKTKPHRH